MSTKGYSFYKTAGYKKKLRDAQFKYWDEKRGIKTQVTERKRNDKGYVLIYCPNHPQCNFQGYVYEHRLVMEKHLGRTLTAKERIHHINGIRNDNRIENLKYFVDDSAHMKFHFPKGSYVGNRVNFKETASCSV